MKHMIVMLAAGLSLTIVTAIAVADDPPSAAPPTTAPAASAVASGSVSGTVLKDGKPVEGMQVRLVVPGRQQPTTAPSNNAAAPNASAHGHRQIVAEATTDASGKFTLSDVPPGSYRVIAGKRGEGIGAMRVSVAAGQAAQVSVNVNPVNANRVRHHKKAGK
jgi:hypothetical protein